MITTAGLLPLGIAVLLAVGSRALAVRMAPRRAVPLLTAVALSAALCTGLVLSATAVLVCVRFQPFPRLGGWSTATLRHDTGIPPALGLAALVIVLGCLGAAANRALHSVWSLHVAARTARGMQPVAGPLVVVPDDAPTAYAVSAGPRRDGRIVVTTGLLRALDADERGVVLAHEQAHLRHRHHLYTHLARLAAAANPLLRAVAEDVRIGVERWADEDAAATVGDRALAARALARTAVLGAPSPAPAAGLGAADHQVLDRVRWLLGPAPVARVWPAALLLGAAAISWAGAAVFSLWADHVVQVAEQVYQRR